MAGRRHAVIAAVLPAVLGLAAAAAADDKGKGDALKPGTVPAGIPLELKVTADKDTYPAVPSPQIGAKDSPPPEVSLTLELRNTGDKEIAVTASGDPFVVLLDLQGPGAVTAVLQRVFTREFRMGRREVLAPGANVKIPLNSLAFGFRGRSNAAYWTRPGEYKLTVAVQTQMHAPPDKDEAVKVRVTAEPVTIKVIEAK